MVRKWKRSKYDQNELIDACMVGERRKKNFMVYMYAVSLVVVVMIFCRGDRPGSDEAQDGFARESIKAKAPVLIRTLNK